MDTENLSPADIVLVHKPSWIAGAIRGVLRFFQRDPVEFSHCLLVLQGDMGVEASASGVRYVSVRESLEKAKKAKILRYGPALGDLIGKKAVLNYATMRLGDHYGFFRLALHLLDQATHSKFFTGIFSRGKVVKSVCSSLVAEGYQMVYGVKFSGVEWASVEPDDIDDHAQDPANEWLLIWEK